MKALKIKFYIQMLVVAFIVSCSGSGNEQKNLPVNASASISNTANSNIPVNKTFYNNTIQTVSELFDGRKSIIVTKNNNKLIVTLVSKDGILKAVKTYKNSRNVITTGAIYSNLNDLFSGNALLCGDEFCISLTSLKVFDNSGTNISSDDIISSKLTNDLDSSDEFIAKHLKTIANEVGTDSTENNVYRLNLGNNVYYYIAINGPMVQTCEVDAQNNISNLEMNLRLGSAYASEYSRIFFSSSRLKDLGLSKSSIQIFDLNSAKLNENKSLTKLNSSNSHGNITILNEWNASICALAWNPLKTQTSSQLNVMSNRVLLNISNVNISDTELVLPKTIVPSHGKNNYFNFVPVGAGNEYSLSAYNAADSALNIAVAAANQVSEASNSAITVAQTQAVVAANGQTAASALVSTIANSITTAQAAEAAALVAKNSATASATSAAAQTDPTFAATDASNAAANVVTVQNKLAVILVQLTEANNGKTQIQSILHSAQSALSTANSMSNQANGNGDFNPPIEAINDSIASINLSLDSINTYISNLNSLQTSTNTYLIDAQNSSASASASAAALVANNLIAQAVTAAQTQLNLVVGYKAAAETQKILVDSYNAASITKKADALSAKNSAENSALSSLTQTDLALIQADSANATAQKAIVQAKDDEIALQISLANSSKSLTETQLAAAQTAKNTAEAFTAQANSDPTFTATIASINSNIASINTNLTLIDNFLTNMHALKILTSGYLTDANSFADQASTNALIIQNVTNAQAQITIALNELAIVTNQVSIASAAVVSAQSAKDAGLTDASNIANNKTQADAAASTALLNESTAATEATNAANALTMSNAAAAATAATNAATAATNAASAATTAATAATHAASSLSSLNTQQTTIEGLFASAQATLTAANTAFAAAHAAAASATSLYGQTNSNPDLLNDLNTLNGLIAGAGDPNNQISGYITLITNAYLTSIIATATGNKTLIDTSASAAAASSTAAAASASAAAASASAAAAALPVPVVITTPSSQRSMVFLIKDNQSSPTSVLAKIIDPTYLVASLGVPLPSDPSVLNTPLPTGFIPFSISFTGGSSPSISLDGTKGTQPPFCHGIINKFSINSGTISMLNITGSDVSFDLNSIISSATKCYFTIGDTPFDIVFNRIFYDWLNDINAPPPVQSNQAVTVPFANTLPASVAAQFIFTNLNTMNSDPYTSIIITPDGSTSPSSRQDILDSSGVGPSKYLKADSLPTYTSGPYVMRAIVKDVLNNEYILDLSSLSGLVSTTQLYLGDGLIVYLPGNLFSNMKKLTFLNLGGNNFTSLDINTFNGLSNLTNLYINHTKLTSLQANIFSSLSSLIFLNLAQNSQLSSLESGVFNGLTNLSTAQLHFNAFGNNLPSNVFNGLPNISSFILFGNAFTTPYPQFTLSTCAGFDSWNTATCTTTP
jgi:hypothetical protein